MSKVTRKLSTADAEREDELADLAEVRQLIEEQELRIHNAAAAASCIVADKLRFTGRGQDAALYRSCKVYTLIAVAAEAAAAKAVGYETWAAFEADQAARAIAGRRYE